MSKHLFISKDSFVPMNGFRFEDVIEMLQAGAADEDERTRFRRILRNAEMGMDFVTFEDIDHETFQRLEVVAAAAFETLAAARPEGLSHHDEARKQIFGMVLCAMRSDPRTAARIEK